MQDQRLIVTLRIDDQSQAFFNAQRKKYFPVERNFLAAHLTLFHQLPNVAATFDYFSLLKVAKFSMQITGLFSLGAGVAYRVESEELMNLQKQLHEYFIQALIPQDRHAFRPHITIQNKVSPELSKLLLNELNTTFRPFEMGATGFDLWTYLDGPWRHEQTCLFS